MRYIICVIGIKSTNNHTSFNMRKLSILGLCLVAALSVSAQKSLVKEVEGKAKGFNADFAAARKMLKPALTNPETANDVQTWYVAGTIEYGDYDNLLGKKAVGQNADGKTMGDDLLLGYDYFIKALPMDSVVEVDKKTGAPKLNKDGSKKIKTKYSKDMVKKIAAHHQDYVSAGQYLWDAKDFDGAYRAWDIYLTLPSNKMLGTDAPAALPDSVVAEISYFQALAAWQAEKLDAALAAFDQALSKGYNKSDIYEYAISVAAQKATAQTDSVEQAKANNKVVYYADLGNKACGDTTVKYLNIIINDKINNRKYDEAKALLEKAIAVSPDNAELYDVLGILYQSQGDLDKAQEYLTKAVSIDSTFPKGQLDMGRVIYAQGAKIDEASSTLPNAEYAKIRKEQVDPLLRQAIPYLENALKNDATEQEARRLLRSIYYSLEDEENLKRIESM